MDGSFDEIILVSGVATARDSNGGTINCLVGGGRGREGCLHLPLESFCVTMYQVQVCVFQPTTVLVCNRRLSSRVGFSRFGSGPR